MGTQMNDLAATGHFCRSRARVLIALLAPALSLAACAKHSSSEAPTQAAAPVESEAPLPPPDPAYEARQLFKTKCQACHGDHGAGDGPASATLDPKPRAFADATWQASVTDDQLKKTIIEGGAAVGKSAAMSSNPELANKPEELAALVKIVRDFKR